MIFNQKIFFLIINILMVIIFLSFEVLANQDNSDIKKRTETNDRYIALIEASEEGDINNVKTILSSGIEIKNENCIEALVRSIKKNHIEIVKILVAAGVEVNARVAKPKPDYFPPTILMVAISMGNAEIIKLLINAGADVRVRAGGFAIGKEFTALSIAIEKGNT